MIGSILVKLKPLTEITCKSRGEECIYKLFLNVIEREDENLAEEIRNLKDEIPITLSPFLKGVKFSKGYTYLFPKDREYATFRITYLKEEVLELILKGFGFLSEEKKAVELGNGKVLIEKVDIQKAAHANFISFKEILSNAKEENTIILEFCSPTFFEIKGKNKLFPLPELVFPSLLKKWNKFSEVKIPWEIEKEFEKIEIEQYRLTTEPINFSGNKIIGFIGKVNYKLSKLIEEEAKKFLNALADFSFYSGVGSKNIIGMGQTRRAS